MKSPSFVTVVLLNETHCYFATFKHCAFKYFFILELEDYENLSYDLITLDFYISIPTVLVH